MNIIIEENITNYDIQIQENLNDISLTIQETLVNTNIEIATMGIQGEKGESGTSEKQQFTAVENQTEFAINGVTEIIFFTRNGIEIAINSRFVSNGIVYYVPIENNNENIKQNDRIIITYS